MVQLWPQTDGLTDYDGDEPYGDFSVDVEGGTPNVTNLRSFEPGLAMTRSWSAIGGESTGYYHGDLIGTTRAMTDPTGSVSAASSAVYTAFGEPVRTPDVGEVNRYGYAGAWGYQAHGEFPFVHVGARYYDPATGRFLQRDPIGIGGGLNVYAYVGGNPTVFVDPAGLTVGESIARGLLWVTGGRRSWLDNKPLVDKLSRTSAAIGIAAGVGALGLSCAGINFAVRIGIHGPHHYFPHLGRAARHLQVNWWRPGVKGSGGVWRQPF